MKQIRVKKQKKNYTGYQWLTPVILATQEAEKIPNTKRG
jgi:hypothetical protein